MLWTEPPETKLNRPQQSEDTGKWEVNRIAFSHMKHEVRAPLLAWFGVVRWIHTRNKAGDNRWRKTAWSTVRNHGRVFTVTTWDDDSEQNVPSTQRLLSTSRLLLCLFGNRCRIHRYVHYTVCVFYYLLCCAVCALRIEGPWASSWWWLSQSPSWSWSSLSSLSCGRVHRRFLLALVPRLVRVSGCCCCCFAQASRQFTVYAWFTMRWASSHLVPKTTTNNFANFRKRHRWRFLAINVERQFRLGIRTLWIGYG